MVSWVLWVLCSAYVVVELWNLPKIEADSRGKVWREVSPGVFVEVMR